MKTLLIKWKREREIIENLISGCEGEHHGFFYRGAWEKLDDCINELKKVLKQTTPEKSCALYVDYEKSCEALKQRNIELGKGV